MGATRWSRVVLGLVAVVVVLAACSSDDGSGGTTGGATTGGASTGATGGGDGTMITIEGFAFHPGSLQVPGQATLTITNNDGVTHTFTLDDGSVDEQVPSGESIEVTVDLSETTGFHCNIHPSMTGTLEVT